MEFSTLDHQWMRHAIALAQTAQKNGEVPVGAVLVVDETVLAEAYNQPITTNDPTAHAEILALRQAAATQRNYRLPGTTLYVTLEPCLMCMGALIHARITRLVFGAFDPKTGAAVSCYQIGSDTLLNHRLEVAGGLLADTCGALLQKFFKQQRRCEYRNDTRQARSFSR
ncbi:MAG TPA: tRNA adenosine(34) deaminase TadA [Desulfofustis sp.]|jgi:tRNA(adenine34) deaminase|nr:tRNA adenosine(34) deaminase TadA [Desulfofustis sp. PB-SRB1]HBH31383.1 tRNA adenosine(34) deaminase TadA [Desulfofustis sp.]